MAARFLRDPEIAAGPAPLRAMRWNPPRTGAELGEQMGELVAESAIDLDAVVFAEPWIKRDQVAARISAAGGAEQTGVPFHVNFAGQFVGAERAQDFTCICFKN